MELRIAFAGHPTGARSAATALNDEDKIESAYRFLLADLMPFGKNAVIRLEHGGVNRAGAGGSARCVGSSIKRNFCVESEAVVW